MRNRVGAEWTLQGLIPLQEGIGMEAASTDVRTDAGVDPVAENTTEPVTDVISEEESPVAGLPVVLPTQTEYRCPGENHSIPRSVHLSRLAAFYPACRECPHRGDTGQLPQTTVERIQQVERRVSEDQSVFCKNGIRGVFMNQLTPQISALIARAFAARLWAEVPLSGRLNGQARRKGRAPGPAVIVGYDERPTSPTILAAVVDSLRLMGCQIIDVGLASRPCFSFAVDHLQAAGGIFVSGSGSPPSWTGLDLLAEGAVPLSADFGLSELEQASQTSIPRPTRSAGFQRFFQPVTPYEAGLWKHFHALRPLHVVTAVRPRTVRKTLRKLFSKLPCRLIEVETESGPNSRVNLESLRLQISSRIEKRNAHLGVLIDDDGSRCEFFDESGNRVPQRFLANFLAEVIRAEAPRAGVVIDKPVQEQTNFAEPINETLGASSAKVARVMLQSKATLGVECNDRYWFRESYTACDAILALARILQGLSQSDSAFSEHIARISASSSD